MVHCFATLRPLLLLLALALLALALPTACARGEQTGGSSYDVDEVLEAFREHGIRLRIARDNRGSGHDFVLKAVLEPPSRGEPPFAANVLRSEDDVPPLRDIRSYAELAGANVPVRLIQRRNVLVVHDLASSSALLVRVRRALADLDD